VRVGWVGGWLVELATDPSTCRAEHANVDAYINLAPPLTPAIQELRTASELHAAVLQRLTAAQHDALTAISATPAPDPGLSALHARLDTMTSERARQAELLQEAQGEALRCAEAHATELTELRLAHAAELLRAKEEVAHLQGEVAGLRMLWADRQSPCDSNAAARDAAARDAMTYMRLETMAQRFGVGVHSVSDGVTAMSSHDSSPDPSRHSIRHGSCGAGSVGVPVPRCSQPQAYALGARGGMWGSGGGGVDDDAEQTAGGLQLRRSQGGGSSGGPLRCQERLVAEGGSGCAGGRNTIASAGTTANGAAGNTAVAAAVLGPTARCYKSPPSTNAHHHHQPQQQQDCTPNVALLDRLLGFDSTYKDSQPQHDSLTPGNLPLDHAGKDNPATSTAAFQQQHSLSRSAARSSVSCVRCGLNDSSSPGACTFHPGLISAPGGLLYTADWQACRAHCNAEEAGCYTRARHFYVGGGVKHHHACVGRAAGGPTAAAADAVAAVGGDSSEPGPRWRLPAPIV